MTDLELMKWALYALEGSNAYDWPVVEELKQRLAQPEQEPVAWLVQYPNKHEFVWGERPQWIAGAIGIEPLYTTPRQWQGLTQREIDELWDLHHDDYGNALSATGYEHAIESKLRERNA